MKIRAGKTFQPVGHCIYCGSQNGKLSREHIIPFSLEGNLIFPQASCAKCADITKKFEQTCSRGIFGPLRIRLGMPTRNPDERPAELSTIIVRKGVKEELRVPSDKLPVSCLGLKLPTPGILMDKEPSSRFDRVEWVAGTKVQDLQGFLAPGEAIRLGRMNPYSFFKLLAKIAHAYAVSQIGLRSFNHFLPDLILGKSHNHAHFIGGDLDQPNVPHSLNNPFLLHYLNLDSVIDSTYVRVSIQLFSFMGMPRYHVIVGEDLRG